MDAKGFELLMAAKILGKGGGSPTPPKPPADGKTRLYISLAEGRLSPVLGLGVNGSVDVDWGDGTDHGTLTGTDTSTLVTIPHTYAQSGDYVITLTAAEGTEIAVFGTNQGALVLTKDGTATEDGRVYRISLKKAYLGDSVTSIGSSAFAGCYGLTSVTIPDGVTSIGSSAFSGCYSLTSVTIPNGVTIIGNYAFISCYSLTNVTIPDSVSNIGSYAFTSCFCLPSVTIPDGITIVGNYLFDSCYSLTNVTIPDGVTNIGSHAFIRCYGLSFIRFEATTPPAVAASTTFQNVPTDCIIYVPEGTLEAYTSATNYPDPDVYSYVEY